MEARKLLEYYYNFILFRPEYPMLKKTDHLVTDDRTYVPYESIFGGESINGYNLYIGQAEIEDLIWSMGEEVPDGGAKAYLCMIRTDKRGYYVKNSFFISPVLFALAKILKEKKPGTQLDLTLINRANDEMDEFLGTFDRKLEYRELKEIFSYVANKLNLSEFLQGFSTLIQERDIYGHSIPDGHLRDLEEILSSDKECPGIETMARNVKNVLKNASPLDENYTPERVKEMISPEKNSLGMWPGHDKITLREQLVINQIINGRDKPFTYFRMIHDKDQALRLLPEIITANLIERAAAMTRYSKPDDAFTEKPFKDNKEFASAYHMPEERLLNNALIMMGKDQGFIDDLEQNLDQVMTALDPNPYFLNGQKPYMVQKFSNNRDVIKFIRDVYKGKKDKGLADQLEGETYDWEEARKSFREVLDRVLIKREEIMQEYRTTFGYQDLLEKGSAASVRVEELKARIESSEASREFKEKEMEKLTAVLEEHELSMQELQNEMGFLRKYFPFFFQNDEKVIRYRSMVEDHKKYLEEMEEEKRELNMILSEYHSLKDELEQEDNNYKTRKTQLEDSAQDIASYRVKYGKGFTDDEILHRLVRENLKQDSGVWLSEEYNDLRKELLAESLKVHRAFLSNSRAFKTDLMLFVRMLEGKIQDRDLDRVYIDLVKVYSMITPVLFIGTDYAPYFLAVAEPYEFKSVFIPEAAQLPLAESAGILWRFKQVTSFNLTGDHWSFPETPQVIAKNLSTSILGVKDPEILDLSLADILNIL